MVVREVYESKCRKEIVWAEIFCELIDMHPLKTFSLWSKVEASNVPTTAPRGSTWLKTPSDVAAFRFTGLISGSS